MSVIDKLLFVTREQMKGTFFHEVELIGAIRFMDEKKRL